MLLVLVVLGIFLFSVRTALIVAVTIPFALLFSFICLDWAHIPANLLSIGAIDFGMIVDGAVVMVENIFRELAERHGQKFDPIAVIRAAAKDVERPIFYAIAVIIAGYLPIYVLTGPVGPAVPPDGRHDGVRADGRAAVLADAAAGALRGLPAKHVKEPKVPFYDCILRGYDRLLAREPAPSRRRRWPSASPIFGASLLLDPVHRRGVHAASRRRRRSGSARRCRTRSPSTRRRSSVRRCASILLSFPQVTTVANELGRPDDGTDPIGFFNDEYFVGLKPYDDPAWRGAIRTKAAADRRDPAEAGGVSRHHLQLHPAGRGRRRRSRDRAEELAGREDLRRRSRDARVQGRSRAARHLRACPASRTSRWCASSDSRA